MAAPARPRPWTPPALTNAWDALVRLCVGTETRRFIFRATVLAFAVRVAILCAAWLTAYIVVGREGQGIGDSLLEMLKRWDATQYERIADGGYPTSGEYQELIVFFPLFPYTVKAMMYVIPSFLVCGLLLSSLASVAAGFFIQGIARADGSDDAEASRSLWFFFVFPTAYFLVMPYTEAMFMALLLGSVYFARKENWVMAGVFGGFCTISRLQGIVLVPALAVEALHQKNWRPQDLLRDWEKMAALFLVPVGFLIYLALNYYLHNDFFAFVDFEDKNWFHHRIWPWESLREAWLYMKTPPGYIRSSIYELRLVTTAIVAILLLIGVKWLRPSYQVFGWVALALFLSVSYQMSLPRYVLTIFPMYFVLARLGRNPEANQALLTVSTMLMATLYVIYAYRWGF